jgi:hypothetical protein
MALGLGIVLIVIGAALVWAINVDISFIDDSSLGWILIIAGVAAIILSLVLNAQRSRATTGADLPPGVRVPLNAPGCRIALDSDASLLKPQVAGPRSMGGSPRGP